jgi:gluconokinase
MHTRPDPMHEPSAPKIPAAQRHRHVGATTRIVIVMGVAGSGKTTVGRLLAQQMAWQFFEGDDFHPAANISKMHAGLPLTDADRWPWLLAIRARMLEVIAQHQHAVFACSALRRPYRDVLRLPGAQFVYLSGDADVIRERLERRIDHFFDRDLLSSQFAILEEPEDALVISVAQSPDAIVREIVTSLVRTANDNERR